ncbi:MAG TPA: ABC transporter permease [Candidatus Acidoferrales bacterium]|nr:ABC transporter permease [Candidatus Acidoferrales bacterium]
MRTLWQDMQYGFRMLRKNPAFTAIAILTLALGIGANTALFSVVDGVLLNPLPYPHPEQLVMAYSKTPQFDEGSISYANFLDWQRNNRSFSALAAFRGNDLNLTGQGEAERLRGYMISADFFRVLGVQAERGRTFTSEEDQPGAAPVALISSGLWKRKFGGSENIVGSKMELNGTLYTIVGVIPGSFQLRSLPRDVYTPIGQWNDPTFRDRRISMGTNAIGRLKSGVTQNQAQSDMDAIAQSLAAAYPEANHESGIKLVGLKKDLVGDIQPFLLVLLGSVAFVLLIACANVANLLLARSTARRREFAVRAAMGASPGRVIRQLLTESVMLALAGGALGLLIAWWGTKAVLSTLPQALPRAKEIGIDAQVLLFTLGISLLAGIVFGLAPALRGWRTDLQETLKEGGRGGSGARNRTQRVFVVVEMAMAVVLLIGAGLMIRSLVLLLNVNPGFNAKNVLTFDVSIPPAVGQNPALIRTALRGLQTTVQSVPGVVAASVTGGSLPMNGDSEIPFWLAGQPKPATDAEMNWTIFYMVQADYAKAMGIPLKQGRFLNNQDTEHTPMVTVIDESFAKKYFPNQDPVGKRIHVGLLDSEAEIVGVVGHVKHWGLDADAKNNLQAQCYLALLQLQDKFMPLAANGVSMAIRTAGAPDAMAGTIRQALQAANSEQVIFDVSSMEEIIAQSLAARRFSMILLGLFAGLALILSSVGIYGVVSYLVGQRVHEIGTRMALGAQESDVLRLVVGEGGKMALIGVGVGLAAAFGLTRLMAQMLYGVSAYDPATFGGVAVLLMGVALAACYIPARRAMRVDPVVALRYE